MSLIASTIEALADALERRPGDIQREKEVAAQLRSVAVCLRDTDEAQTSRDETASALAVIAQHMERIVTAAEEHARMVSRFVQTQPYVKAERCREHGPEWLVTMQFIDGFGNASTITDTVRAATRPDAIRAACARYATVADNIRVIEVEPK